MTWLPFFLLWTLAVVDGGFAGFRAAAGRNGHIFKEAYYRAAIRRGMLMGLGSTLGVGVTVGIALAASPSATSRLAELSLAAQPMVLVLGAYASLVLIALGVWSVAEADFRTLASVVILGPFTLIRPWVIAGAGAAGAWVAPSAATAFLVVAACGFQLLVEPALSRQIVVALQLGPRK